MAYYKETDGGYVETPQNFGDPSTLKQPMPSAVADFNGEGLLEVYICYPGVQDFTQFGHPAKSTLGFQGLYINDGKGGFIDATKNLNIDPVSYDRSDLSPVLLNKSGGQFVENAKSIYC